MKLAMISFKKFINDYDKKMHVDSVRINEYFKNLKSIFMTDFYYIDGNNLIGEDKIINLLDINFFSNYDLIFFYHESTIEKIINSIGLENTNLLISKNKCVIQLDCLIWQFTLDELFMSNFNAVGISHPNSYIRLNHKNKELIHNACINREENINIDKNGDLVYIGRINQYQNKSKLIKLANQIKRNINLYTFDNCDDIKNEYITIKEPIPYSKIPDELNNKSFGICFYDNESPCGKVFDYISCGLPVL